MARGKKSEGAEPDAIDQLITKWGGLIRRAEEVTSPWTLKRLPTGLASLDIEMKGGLPAGTLCMFIGEPGIGKNTFANYVIAKQQQLFGANLRVGIIITEGSLDKDQMRFNGVVIADSPEELAAFIRGRKKRGQTVTRSEITQRQQQIGQFVVATGDTTDKLFEVALDMVRSRKFDVVLIDSFGSVLLENDVDKALTDNDRMAGPAGLNTKFATRLFSALAPDAQGNPNMTSVIGINQVRANMRPANPNSPTKIESGGYSLKHTRSVAIEFSVKGRMTDKEKSAETGGKVRSAKEVMWEITKQKAGAHEGGSGSYTYRFEEGAHFALDILRCAIKYGIVQQEGNSFYFTDEEGDTALLGPKKNCGLLAAADYIEEDADFTQYLYDRVIDAAFVQEEWESLPLYGNELIDDLSVEEDPVTQVLEAVSDLDLEDGPTDSDLAQDDDFNSALEAAIQSEDRERLKILMTQVGETFPKNIKMPKLLELARAHLQ